MGQGHRPVFAEFLRYLRKYETVGDALEVGVVIAECIVLLALRRVPHVEDCIAAHFLQALGVGLAPDRAFQPQARAELPVRREVLGDLDIDGADCLLQFGIRNLGLSKIDDRDQHVPSRVRLRFSSGARARVFSASRLLWCCAHGKSWKPDK